MKKATILLMMAFILLSLTGVVGAETAEIKFVNECSFWIKVYVDGVPSGSIPPGHEQTTFANLGTHTLKAVSVEAEPRTLTESITLTEKGFEWTLEEKKK